ncbi:MAG: ribonuclease J [Aerococcus sp.]|nr:ribonuclease J [Aerococcus sp.]
MSDIKLISLGGVREDGKNMYVVEVNDTLYILDCGLIYPPDEMLGIDVMIPDFTYLKEHEDQIAGVFLTHEHADAIGALPYLLREIEVPVFGTELTISLAKLECNRLGVKNYKDFYVIDESNEIEFDDVTVKFFNTTHSVPESVGISIVTDEGAIVYTGDFKFDMTVGADYQTDFKRINEIANDGVLALLSESQQAESPISNAPEIELEQAIMAEFQKAAGRVIVAATESNILRIQQIIDVAHRVHRHIFLSGDDVEKIIDVAIRYNKLTIPSKDLFKQMDELGKYKDHEIVILETGTTAEPLMALQKMAQNQHGTLNIQDGDMVMLATTPSAGMETIVADTKDIVYRAGGRTVDLYEEYHSSGHATPKDLQLMIQLMRPQYVFPVSGEYRLMHAHRKLALDCGIPDERIYLMDKGDVLHYQDGTMYLMASVPAANVLIDGSGVGDIGNIVLKDRRILSEDGIFVIIATISRNEGKILAGPEVISRGFVFMKQSTDIIEGSKALATDVLNESLQHLDQFDWSTLKGDIREAIGKYLYQETQRRPMILPVIMEASTRRKKRNFKKKS